MATEVANRHCVSADRKRHPNESYVFGKIKPESKPLDPDANLRERREQRGSRRQSSVEMPSAHFRGCNDPIDKL